VIFLWARPSRDRRGCRGGDPQPQLRAVEHQPDFAIPSGNADERKVQAGASVLY
jgi:hypothetical protein